MPPQHVDPESIFKEVEEHNEFFDSLVDMIPAKLYVGNAAAGNDQSAGLHAKYQKGQNKDSRDAKKSNLKLDKKNKFDPTQQESTRVKKRRIENQDADESDHDFMGDIQFQDKHEEEDEVKGTDSSPSGKATQAKNSPHQSRIEELRAKLKAKIDAQKNSSVTNGTSDTIVSKRAARRAEKKRRVDLAKKKQTQIIIPGGKTVTGKNGLAAIKIVKELGGSRINNDTNKTNSVVDDLAGIDFGGIAGLKDDLLKGRYTGVNKSLKNLGKKKSLERLLEEAEAKKARLRELKESEDIDDKQKAKKMEWGEALKAASGEKIRDTDTTILKKAIKRKAKKKARSAEAWKSRMEQTNKKMDDRQNIRDHNIKQRAIGGIAGANLSSKRIKDDDKDDKEGGAKGADAKGKRPRLGPHAGGRAGFEGKKQDFINKGGNKKNTKSQ